MENLSSKSLNEMIKINYRPKRYTLLLHATSIIATISTMIISIFSMFITEKSFSKIIDSQYFILTISILLPLILIFFVAVIIYQINKKRKSNKVNIYKQIKIVENELFTNINVSLDKFLTGGVQNE
jgi:uncharacterized membrane protein